MSVFISKYFLEKHHYNTAKVTKFNIKSKKFLRVATPEPHGLNGHDIQHCFYIKMIVFISEYFHEKHHKNSVEATKFDIKLPSWGMIYSIVFTSK